MSVFTSLFFALSLHAVLVSGVVRDAAGHALSGATVSSSGAQTVTDRDGNFALDVPSGSATLRVMHPGFQNQTVPAVDGRKLEVVLLGALDDAIVVSGIRADATTPVTKTDLPRERIEKEYYGQDIPLLLRDTPSVNTYTESGVGGSGYSYFTLRGINATRINTTLDGVPLADSEDMGVYFADFPDLAASLQSIQIQRGVGTSTVGAPSFGGSINLQSIDLSDVPRTEVRVGGGSFGSRMASASYQTGSLPGGFALYARLSADESDGFRDSSGVRQRNLFVSAAKQGDRSQWKFTGLSGHEHSQLAFFAVDADTLRTDLRNNPLSTEDKDSFGYDLGQVQYLRALSDGSTMTASVFYQRGYGSYRLFDDETTKSGLRAYGLDGMLYGGMATVSTSSGPFSASYGLHLNEFRREHTRDLVNGPRDYYNYGTKGEANAFARVRYDGRRWHLFGDGQIRTTDFHYHGDVAIAPIRWTFFNPKVGARYDLTARSGVYASLGMSTREPTRNDLFQGEDNATVVHDLRAVRPERLYDIEAGWDHHSVTTALSVNAYAMEFRHEIASTGELSDIGLLLRRNVDRSYRRGVEVEGSWQATARLRFRTNANVSRNRIASWTQFYDVYDTEGSLVGSQPIVHRNVTPVLTPSLTLSQGVELTPVSRLRLGLVGRYVSRQFLDNTNNRSFMTPALRSLDATVAVQATSELAVTLQVNNLTSRRDLYPSGYSYLYLQQAAGAEASIQGVSYFFPQATRNFVVMVDFKK